VADVPDHLAETLALVLPLLPVAGDLVGVAADEVPPHDDVLAERRAADEHRAHRRRSVVAQSQPVGPDARVPDRGARHRHTLEAEGSGIHQHSVLEERVDRQLQQGAGIETQFGGHERGVHVDRGCRAQQRAQEDQRRPALERDGFGLVVLEAAR